MDENALVKACLKGNRSAQHDLYKKYASKMLGVCYRYARNGDDAQDLLQDGFIKVFTSLHKFRNEGSFEGWVRSVMVHCCLDYIKKQKVVFEPVELAESVSWNENDLLETKELMDEIRKLPSGFRTVFNLFAIEGYSHKEIAEMLSISESTSRSQYARARALLITRIKHLNKERINRNEAV